MNADGRAVPRPATRRSDRPNLTPARCTTEHHHDNERHSSTATRDDAEEPKDPPDADESVAAETDDPSDTDGPVTGPVSTGAESVVAALEAAGAETAFGVQGGAIMPVYDALYDSSIRHVTMAHEQGAAHAADAYGVVARRTRTLSGDLGTGRDEPRHRHRRRRHGLRRDARVDRPGRCPPSSSATTRSKRPTRSASPVRSRSTTTSQTARTPSATPSAAAAFELSRARAVPGRRSLTCRRT